MCMDQCVCSCVFTCSDVYTYGGYACIYVSSFVCMYSAYLGMRSCICINCMYLHVFLYMIMYTSVTLCVHLCVCECMFYYYISQLYSCMCLSICVRISRNVCLCDENMCVYVYMCFNHLFFFIACLFI